MTPLRRPPKLAQRAGADLRRETRQLDAIDDDLCDSSDHCHRQCESLVADHALRPCWRVQAEPPQADQCPIEAYRKRRLSLEGCRRRDRDEDFSFRSQSSRIKRREKILNSTKATSKAVIGRVDPEYSGDRGKIFANHVAVKYLQSRVLCKISLVNSRMVV